MPLGSGLSSSAAFEVATALAVLSLIGASYPGPKLARLCQRAENEFVGASCGIMDQFISANGDEDHALLLDCRDLSFKLAPIPANVALVIANTMVKHAVTGGEYTSRRAEVEEAAAVIARPSARGAFSARCDGGGSGKVGNRDERQRVEARAPRDHREHADGGSGGSADQDDKKELGRLMAEAHASYSKDFEASCMEADAMVALAQDLPGLIGARLTGGGFGGCTINLVERGHAAGFSEALGARYATEMGIVPQIFICHASGGARRLSQAFHPVA